MKHQIDTDRLYQRLFIVIILSSFIYSNCVLAGASLPPQTSLPDVILPQANFPEIDSAISYDITPTCGNNPLANQLAKLIQDDLKQQRKTLICNDKLNEIALIKANILLQKQDVWHNAGHMSPNQLLRHHGFKLPKTYPLFGNQVEAIAGGKDKPEILFQDFINSAPHRQLLLGENEFFQEQNQMGVAYIKDLSTEHQHYWVVIIAAPYTEQEFKPKHIVEITQPAPVKSDKRRRLEEVKERMRRNRIKDRWK